VAPTPAHWVQLGPDAPGRIRQNLDLPALERQAGAIERPLVVVEDETEGAAAPDGLARHWAAPTVTVARNYGYAFQWFAMSAAAVLLYLWLQFLRPRRRPADR
jgi:surfeit locus 1 family protein